MRFSFKMLLCFVLLLSLVSCKNNIKDEEVAKDVAVLGKVEEPSAEVVEEEVVDETSDVATLENTTVSDVAINNGSLVVGYKGKTYMYIEDDKEEGYAYYNIYSIDDITMEKVKITDNIDNSSTIDFYIIDDYLYYSLFMSDGYNIFKISLETGEGNILDKGYIKYIDEKDKEIYYEKYNHYLSDTSDDNEGIFKMNLDGDGIEKICNSDYVYLEKVEDTIYLEHYEDGDKVILSSVDSNGENLKDIATFTPDIYSDSETESVRLYEQEQILDFYIYQDTIILSIGSYQGSGSFFYGSNVKLDINGENIVVMPRGEDKLEIIDNWLYYNSDLEGKENELYRMDIFTFEEEFYDTLKLSSVNNITKEIYGYLGKADEKTDIFINDLYLLDTKTKDKTLIFNGSKAILEEDSYYIGYDVYSKVNDYIYFENYVSGYDIEKDGLRCDNCILKFYQVNNNCEEFEIIY